MVHNYIQRELIDSMRTIKSLCAAVHRITIPVGLCMANIFMGVAASENRAVRCAIPVENNLSFSHFVSR